MHPEVASALARARDQDLQRSIGSNGPSNHAPLSWSARRRWRPLPGRHLRLASHRLRIGH